MEENIIVVDLPPRIRAFTIVECGETTIVLNAMYNRECNCNSYVHEMSHLENGDFYCCKPADEIEAERHM